LAARTLSIPQRRAVIFVDTPVSVAVRPIPLSVPIILRSAFELVLGHCDAIAAQVVVVLETSSAALNLVRIESAGCAMVPNLRRHRDDRKSKPKPELDRPHVRFWSSGDVEQCPA
jgi:hypothetical protein